MVVVVVVVVVVVATGGPPTRESVTSTLLAFAPVVVVVVDTAGGPTRELAEPNFGLASGGVVVDAAAGGPTRGPVSFRASWRAVDDDATTVETATAAASAAVTC